MNHRMTDGASRRTFLARSLVAASAGLVPWTLGAPVRGAQPTRADKPGASRRPRVAALFTEFRLRSHAYNILENFLGKYYFRGQLVDPGVDVVSFYADQFPEGDMAREAARRFNIPLYPTIEQALTLGGKALAVDAVLLIGEHGDYPTNALGQRMYPRKEFFDQALAVMKASGRYVPLFNDKHLSYRWDWAKAMYDASREHGFPLMAGSSVPLAERHPPLELPDGAEIEEAVSIHGGGIESYDFHALEVLQSLVESRKGGETGITRVELLTGDALSQAERQGRWSRDLVEAALAAEDGLASRRRIGPRPGVTAAPVAQGRQALGKDGVSHAVLLTYKDGLRAAALKVGNTSDRWNFACRVRGESKPSATAFFNGPWGNRCLFKALSHAIQYLYIHQREPYPVERTLLVSGILESAMQSHAAAGRAIDTPHLEFAYAPIDFRAQRENGATWRIITRDTIEPQTFEPGDERLANLTMP